MNAQIARAHIWTIWEVYSTPFILLKNPVRQVRQIAFLPLFHNTLQHSDASESPWKGSARLASVPSPTKVPSLKPLPYPGMATRAALETLWDQPAHPALGNQEPVCPPAPPSFRNRCWFHVPSLLSRPEPARLPQELWHLIDDSTNGGSNAASTLGSIAIVIQGLGVPMVPGRRSGWNDELPVKRV